MRSLAARFAAAVFVAMLLSGLGFAIVYAMETPDDARHRGRLFLEDTLRLRGESALARVERGETAAVARELAGLAERTSARVFVFGPDGQVVGAGEPSAETRSLVARVGSRGRPEGYHSNLPSGFFDAVPLTGGGVVAVELPSPPRPPTLFGALETLPIRIAIVIVAIAIVATMLARYLTRPVNQLRGAAGRLADGELDVRVADALRDAPVELSLLGRDFDRMAERIATLLDSKERLLRDVSHELRSPLARLSLALALARKRAGDGPSPELDRIELEANRLAELVGHVLTLARLADDAPIGEEAIAVRPLVEQVVADASFEASAEGKRVMLVVTSEPHVRAPAEALRWAVENVVRNAIAHSPQGGEVAIEVSERGGRLHVVVRDHGGGVPDDALESIFRPFYRVGTDRDRKTGGTGVGLAICARVAARCGGSAYARNAEGGGLEVTLEFPLAGSTG